MDTNLKQAYAEVRPKRSLNLLTQREIESVANTNPSVYQLFRRCALATLNSGNEDDDESALIQRFADFDIKIVHETRGIMLQIYNAPASSFVDGKLVNGLREHLFSVLRDVVYTAEKLAEFGRFDVETSEGITDAVFRILRNARIVRSDIDPQLVVCWGGHSIGRVEYSHCKEVGYELGLQELDIGTGCGPGAMKAPMKGAVVGHGKQQHRFGRYLGITEPSIIASEAPNPTVNELVILPDIEKRLEAFVRLAHAIIVFPGGAGTAEEVLYLLGVKMAPENTNKPMPLLFSAPEESAAYFEQLDAFIVHTLGEQARKHYRIIIGDPREVARQVKAAVAQVQNYRNAVQESYAFNWQLHIPHEMQKPFVPSHDNMRGLNLHIDQPKHELAVELRRAFSGIVAGNVKGEWVRAVKQHGPYQLDCDTTIQQALDNLLKAFVADGRMKLNGEYTPCYELI